MSASKKFMFALHLVLMSAATAVFGIPATVHANSSGILIAADDSKGSYGGTSDDTEQRPGAATPSNQDSNTSGSAVDDSMITAKVKSALISDDDVKAFDINVKTRKGEVVLTGMVDNQDQIDRAVQLASNVDGVTSVSNRLTVKK